MQETKQTTAAIKEPTKIRKKIGKTTHEIEIHFSKTNTENVHGKLKWIILNDYAKLKNLPD